MSEMASEVHSTDNSPLACAVFARALTHPCDSAKDGA